MPRTSRILNKGEKTIYHVISRTALDGASHSEIKEKEEFVKNVKQIKSLYFLI